MPALKLDVTIEQGVDFQREFACDNADTGAPMDFSGYSGAGALYYDGGSTAASFDVTFDGNKVLAALDEEKTTGLIPSKTFNGRYVIKATHPTLPDYRIAEGQVLISAG